MEHLNGSAMLVNPPEDLLPINNAALGILISMMSQHGCMAAESRLTALLTGLNTTDQHQYRLTMDTERNRWRTANPDKQFPPAPVYLANNGEVIAAVEQVKAEAPKSEAVSVPTQQAPQPDLPKQLPAIFSLALPVSNPLVQRKLQFSAASPVMPTSKEHTSSAPATSRATGSPERSWVEVAAAVPASDPHMALGKQMGTVIAGAVAHHAKAITATTKAGVQRLEGLALTEAANRGKLALELAALSTRHDELCKEVRDKAFYAAPPVQPPPAPVATCDHAAHERRITRLEHSQAQPAAPAPSPVIPDAFQRRLEALEGAPRSDAPLTNTEYERRLSVLESYHARLEANSTNLGLHDGRLLVLEAVRTTRAEARLAEQERISDIEKEQIRQAQSLTLAITELAALQAVPAVSWQYTPSAQTIRPEPAPSTGAISPSVLELLRQSADVPLPDSPPSEEQIVDRVQPPAEIQPPQDFSADIQRLNTTVGQALQHLTDLSREAARHNSVADEFIKIRQEQEAFAEKVLTDFTAILQQRTLVTDQTHSHLQQQITALRGTTDYLDAAIKHTASTADGLQGAHNALVDEHNELKTNINGPWHARIVHDLNWQWAQVKSIKDHMVGPGWRTESGYESPRALDVDQNLLLQPKLMLEQAVMHITRPRSRPPTPQHQWGGANPLPHSVGSSMLQLAAAPAGPEPDDFLLEHNRALLPYVALPAPIADASDAMEVEGMRPDPHQAGPMSYAVDASVASTTPTELVTRMATPESPARLTWHTPQPHQPEMAYEHVEHTTQIRVITSGGSSPLIARVPVLNDDLSPRGVYQVTELQRVFNDLDEWAAEVNRNKQPMASPGSDDDTPSLVAQHSNEAELQEDLVRYAAKTRQTVAALAKLKDSTNGLTLAEQQELQAMTAELQQGDVEPLPVAPSLPTPASPPDAAKPQPAATPKTKPAATPDRAKATTKTPPRGMQAPTVDTWPEIHPSLSARWLGTGEASFKDNRIYLTREQQQLHEQFFSRDPALVSLAQDDPATRLHIFTADNGSFVTPKRVMLDSGAHLMVLLSETIANRMGLTWQEGTSPLKGVGGVGGSRGRADQAVHVRLGGCPDADPSSTAFQGCYTLTCRPIIMTDRLVQDIGHDVLLGQGFMRPCLGVIDHLSERFSYSPAWMKHGCADFRVSVPCRMSKAKETPAIIAMLTGGEEDPRNTTSSYCGGLDIHVKSGQPSRTAVPIAPGMPQTAIPKTVDYLHQRLQQSARNLEDHQAAQRLVARAQHTTTKTSPQVLEPQGVVYSVQGLKQSGRLMDGLRLDLSGAPTHLMEQVASIKAQLRAELLQELRGNVASTPARAPVPIPTEDPIAATVTQVPSTAPQTSAGKNHLPYEVHPDWLEQGACLSSRPAHHPGAHAPTAIVLGCIVAALPVAQAACIHDHLAHAASWPASWIWGVLFAVVVTFSCMWIRGRPRS